MTGVTTLRGMRFLDNLKSLLLRSIPKAGRNMNQQVILYEPQCFGFEHSSFNAALLYTVLLAYPDAQVTFMGEREHLVWVRQVLAQEAEVDERRVKWQEIAIPSWKVGRIKLLNSELTLSRYVLGVASTPNLRFLLFYSITSIGLFFLKVLMLLKGKPVPILVIPHGVLNTISDRQPRKPWSWLLSLRQVLRMPHPKRLRYIVLGESIYRVLLDVLPTVASNFQTLDHPRLWAHHNTPLEIARGQLVRFGYLGVSATGRFDVFCRIAAEIQREASPKPCQFVMVGFVNQPGSYPVSDQDAVKGVSYTPLSVEEYARRASSLTYAVGTATPKKYSLVASNSFLDALSYIKPGIYLRNPYIEYYFSKMGDIGYLCDSYQEMRSVILSILKEFPLASYQQQCENILQCRKIFEPQVLAPKLRAIIDDIE